MGNARVAFAVENEGVVCLAAVETEYQSFEENTLLNTNLREPNATANYTVDNTIDANEVVRLRGNDSNRQTGPGKLMQVMVGDTLSMEVFAYHQGGYTDNGSVNNATILSALISSITGAAPSGTEASNISSAINNNATSIFVGSSGNSSQPRAYLNYILFDKDFKFVDAGYNQVGNTSGAHQQLMITKPVEQAGFIYIYLSNESNTTHDVYFDDLRITHTKSKILQEDHYYPGGATISALSSSAPLSKPNRFKYQGKEEQAEFGLNLLNFEARMYDPWLWKTLTHDPLAELFYEWSPYHWAGNNPVINIDPSGQDWYRFTDENGNQSVLWQEGNAATVDGVTCSNIGENYYHVQEGLLTVFNQNEIVRSAYLDEISEERRSELASMDESPVFEHLCQEQYNDLLLGLNGELRHCKVGLLLRSILFMMF